MKQIFITIPMTNEPELLHYPVDGNSDIEYEGKVRFAVNAVLARTMKKDERVKVVCVMNDSGDTEKYKNYFKNDLDEINKNIGAKIEYVEVKEKFLENASTLHSRFKQCIATLENDVEIIADITFAQKTLVPIIFSVLGFAQKFFNAKIQYIVYGKVEFDREKNRPKPETAMLCDITSLFYLNNLTSTMKASSGEKAVKIIEDFFTL